MKPNLYYVGILATTLLVLSGPASFATTTDPTQLTETTTDQTETSPEGVVTVAVGEGSNETVQHYTYTPQSVEINAGESVTWFTPAEFVELHTVTFVQDPSILSDIILPFVPAGATDFELLPPFNLGEPILIPTPDGREAIVAVNKHAFYPAIVDANDQTTYLEGTDIQAPLNSTVKVLNSGIIFPPLPPMGEDDQNRTAAGAAEIPAEAVINETTTTMTNATNNTADTSAVPDEDGATPQATEGATGEQPMGPPFPLVSSFTVTFEEPGTYAYFCALHPWMQGEVVVRGDIQTETQPDIQTETQEGDIQTETQAQNQTETEGLSELESANPIFG